MRYFLALLLAILQPAHAGVTTMPVDGPSSGPDSGAGRGSHKRTNASGDVEVGPDASARPKPQPSLPENRVPGIYPVYESGRHWLLIERAKKRKSLLKRGSRLLVIGSNGAAVFYAAVSTKSWSAACSGARHVPTPGYLLSSKSGKNFKRVGTPIIALLLKDRMAFDISRAWFYPLKNEVKESTYQELEKPIRDAVVRELASGDYQVRLEDEQGQRMARDPDPDKIQLKIEFGSKIRVLGYKDAFLEVEGTQIAQTYRRCMRLFSSNEPVGGCAQMPHALMMETRLLNFVAYDPNRTGQPFILAYSKDEPLWGHERWGFRVTPGGGPRLFLRDALDPRCRDSF